MTVADNQHVEKTLLAAMTDSLADISVGGRPVPVLRSRVFPLSPDDMPAIRLYRTGTRFSEATGGTIGRRIVRREVAVTLAILVSAPTVDEPDVEDTLLDIAAEVEDRLDRDFAPDGRFYDVATKLTRQKEDTGSPANAAQSMVVTRYAYVAAIHHAQGSCTHALTNRGN